MSDVLTFIDAHLGRFRSELYDFLSIPSISANAEYDGETRRAADWLADRLTRAGLETEIIETGGSPDRSR